MAALPGPRRRRGGGRGAGAALVGGRFVALEGVDGSGKTTQAGMLAEALSARGLDVLLTREPGGTALGEALRELLLARAEEGMSLAAEAALFAAARAELVARVVRPALVAGRIVVTDRFLDSSLAYQGVARGLGLDAVLALNRPALAGCLPDLSLVIDTPVHVAARRRCAGPDRIEAEGEGFQARVRDGYLELLRRFPERVALVEADGTPDDVHAEVLRRVEPLLVGAPG